MEPEDRHALRCHDLVVETLALGEAELREALADARADRDLYREMLQAALTQLAALTRRLNGLVAGLRAANAQARRA